MPRFELPDFSMHYEVVDGILPRDTLFLHGNLSSNLWWDPAMEEWRRQAADSRPSVNSGTHANGRAILAEWRGCGDSREFKGGLDIHTLAGDANALLRHLGITQANIVGHSTGGLIALHALACAPQLYHRALLLDPVSPDGLELPAEIASAFERMSQDFDFCSAVILSTVYGGDLSPEFREKIARVAFGVAPEVWLGVPRMLQQPSKLDTQKITHPVLVAHGQLDQVLPLEKSRALAGSLLKGRFMEIGGRGHCTNVEDPERFTGIVNGFLF